MKRWIALLLCLLVPALALAEEAADGLDTAPLQEAGFQSFVEEQGIDTVWRDPAQPFLCQTDAEDAECIAFLDLVQLAQEGRLCLRLTLSLSSEELFDAAELAVTAGGSLWTFPVLAVYSEYDTVFFEDYTIGLSDESLPLMQSLARNRSGEVPFTLTAGERTLTGTIALPAEQAKALSALYKACGGEEQDLTCLREKWPVTVTKAP